MLRGFRGWSVLENAEKLGKPDDSYYPAFANAIMELFEYVGGDDYISLICDDDEETALKAYFHYRAIRRAMPEIQEKTVSLAFADDEHFPALQAADIASWLARREAQFQFHKMPYEFRELYNYMMEDGGGTWKMEWRAVFADEDMHKMDGCPCHKPG